MPDFPFAKDVLDRIAELGATEAGEIVNLSLASPDLPGLPPSIPISKISGKDPGFESMREFFDEWRIAPERREGTAKVLTLTSFIDLANRHKDADSAVFFSTVLPNPYLLAVIDYHTLDHVARFGKHRVLYEFPLSDEFKRWLAFNGKMLNQAEFAEFIEDRIADMSVALDAEKEKYETLFKQQFAVPTEVLELSRGLAINVGRKVKNTIRLQSGEATVSFEEEHRTESGEPVHVPGLFMLSLRAFVGGGEVRIPARLRYRAKDGAILWGYNLYDHETTLRDRVTSDAAIVAKQTELPVFEGSPE